MSRLFRDLRLAFRTLANRPTASLIAVITLALGIGANGAIFSIVDRVLLHPLPFPNAGQLVQVWESKPSAGFDRFEVSTPNFLDWRREVDAFQGLGALVTGSATLTGLDDPEVLTIADITANLPSVLGITPVRGRLFTPEEETGEARVVLISDGFWQRRFGGADDVLGQRLDLNGTAYEVVGVLPSTTRYIADGVEIFAPMDLTEADLGPRGARYLTVLGRLKGGVSPAEAEQQLDALARRLEERYAKTNTGWETTLSPLVDVAVEKVRFGLVVLFVAVGLILLIACGNVANLELVRTAGRSREIALRQALGANRGHLVRQIFLEDLSLGLAGGLVGLVLAVLGTRFIVSLSPENLPQLSDVGFSASLVVFILLTSLVTVVVFGLVPALQMTRPVNPDDLKEGGRGTGASRGARRTRKILVVAQLALAVVLLFGAALLLRSFWNLQSVDPGFETDDTLLARVSMPASRYADMPQRIAFGQQLLERVRAMPGVDAAALSNGLPMDDWFWGFRIEGKVLETGAERPTVLHRVVDGGYFRALGIPLLSGRTFDDRDTLDAPGVVILDDTAARTYFPGTDPVGKRISFSIDEPQWLEVVGRVGATRQLGLDNEPFPGAYVPFTQVLGSRFYLVVRTSGQPLDLVPSLRAQIRAVDSEVPIYNVETMRQHLAASLARPRFLAMLLVIFGALATVLAVIGIYGVTADSVNQRRYEFGTRIALGARRGDILRLVLLEGARLAGVGLGLGLVLALVLSRFLGSLLYGVGTGDPLTLVGVCLLLAAVVLAACFFPARRASRVEPLMALRYE